VRFRGDEPLIVSEFGNWGLPDVAGLRRHYGGEPWWFETGLEWADGIVYPHGIEERFKHYHLDRIFPTLSDLSAASQRLQFAGLKYEIEQMRRHPTIAGYVITELTDVHWECNGLLDMCRHPKLFYEAIGRINSDDLIIPHWRRVAFWEGEQGDVELLLSHFSMADLAGSRLEWRLDIAPDIAGSFAGLAPRPAAVTAVGVASFTVPAVERGTRARLEFRLFDAAGMLVASNEQELYFFPCQAAGPGAIKVYAPTLAWSLSELGYSLVDSPATADVVLVEELTDELRPYLLQGGRVLWLAESSQSRQTFAGHLNVVERKGSSWQGDWASTLSWIRQDRLFGALPTQGVVDFAFAGLTPEHVITGFSPDEFATDVYAGLFVGWLHKPVALVGERRVGEGRLMISTFRLSQRLTTHPAAAILLSHMLSHMLTHRASP
ncbi:MAG: glycoside hydrolase family 2, partial [Chloroflexi bacterium]|nr:glycoside hydrolase family 2 [Chloroflexota bacterium]